MTAGVFAALFLLTATGAHPGPKAEVRSHGGHGLDIEIPDVDIDMPDIDIDVPDIDIPDIEVPEIAFDALDDLPQVVAMASSHGRDRDEDEDSDSDSDEDEKPSRDERGARIYKMTPQAPRIRVPSVRVEHDDDDDWDDRSATAQAKGRGTATLQVRGPVTFQLRAQAGEIEVVTTDKPQVTVRLSDTPTGTDELALYAFGDRVEPSFRGRRTLRHGKLRVELPKGSRLDVSSMSGDVVAQRLSDVRIRTMSGDVKLSGVSKADVQTISGDVRIDEASGPVRLHTVSGKGTITSTNPAPQIEFQSASGDMEWSGICAKDCHLSAETVSGALALKVDPKSSFELSYTSHSGELRDGLNMTVKRAPKRRHGMASGWLEATFGRGEGVIEADAFSGNLAISRR